MEGHGDEESTEKGTAIFPETEQTTSVLAHVHVVKQVPGIRNQYTRELL